MAMNSAGGKSIVRWCAFKVSLLSSEPAWPWLPCPLWNHRGVKVFKESVPNNSYGGAAWCFLLDYTKLNFSEIKRLECLRLPPYVSGGVGDLLMFLQSLLLLGPI